MAKRANHEGSIFKRKRDGMWVGRISLGRHPETGKRLMESVYGTTQKEVRERLEKLKTERVQVRREKLNRETLATYLQRWLDEVVGLQKSRATISEYELTVRRYIVPFIGKTPMTKLEPTHLQTWQLEMRNAGFTDNMRLRAIRILRIALNHAIRLKLRTDNPCNAIDKPKLHRDERRVLSPEDCQRLFRECEPHRLGDLIVLAVMTGLRKRELFALEWSDVNLREGVITVRRSVEELSSGRISAKHPKTRAGRRAIMLGQPAVGSLQNRMHKAKTEGLPPEEVPLIFPDTTGGYLRGSNFDRRCWYPIREAAGISDSLTFHDLRHTAASLLIAAGVDITTVQQRLGHTKASTTLDTYAHMMPDSQANAVARVDALLADSKLVSTK